MTGGGNRRNARNEFLARLILRNLVTEHAEHTLGVEHLRTRNLGQLAHVALIGPESRLDFRNHDLGMGERRLVIRSNQPIDVISDGNAK